MTPDELLGKFCCARACTAKREAGFIMCTPHWTIVPPNVQRQVIRAMGALAKDPGAHGRRGRLLEAMNAARTCVEWAEAQAEATARATRRAQR